MYKAEMGMKLTTGEITYRYDYESKTMQILKSLDGEEVARIMKKILVDDKLKVDCIKIREKVEI